MLHPSPPLRSSPHAALFLYTAALKTKKTTGSPIPSVGAVVWAASLAYLLLSPIATSTPTMPYPLPHPGLEHEGDERINKVSFVVAFCVDTSTKQSKLHSPRERTFVLPPSPQSRQFSSQGPSIPPSTSSSTTLLTLPQTPMPTPTLHRHSPPRQCRLHQLVLYEKWKGTKQNKKVSLIFRILKTAISVSPDTFAAAYPAAPLPLRPPL